MGDQLDGQAAEIIGQGDEHDGGVLVRNGGTLRPFRKGDGRAAAAGKRGAAVRTARRAAARGTASQVAAELRTVVDTFTREELGPSCAAAAGLLVGRIVRGEVPVRHAGDAAELLRVLVDVARLEAGEPTSASVVAHLGADAAARVVALREEARATLRSSSVQAAAALPGGAAAPTTSTAGGSDDGGVPPA